MLNNIHFVALPVSDVHISFFCNFQSSLFSKDWCCSNAFDCFSFEFAAPHIRQLNESTLPLKAKQPAWETPLCLCIKTQSMPGNLKKNILFRNQKRARTEQCKAKYVYQLLKCCLHQKLPCQTWGNICRYVA